MSTNEKEGTMSKNSYFEKGRNYSRDEIHRIVGGQLQTYMPHVNHRVVCICLRKDINPAFDEARDPSEQDLKVILVGEGDGVEAAATMLTNQYKDEIPTFVKKASDAWEFKGYFEFHSETTNKDAIRDYSKYAETKSGKIVKILFVKESKDFEQKVITRKAG
jgi:hypothetical protein